MFTTAEVVFVRFSSSVIIFVSTLALLSVGLCSPVLAQFQEGGDEGGAALGKSRTQRWKAGMTVTAQGGQCNGIVGYAPVPVDWPEQQVTVVEEDISPARKLATKRWTASLR